VVKCGARERAFARSYDLVIWWPASPSRARANIPPRAMSPLSAHRISSPLFQTVLYSTYAAMSAWEPSVNPKNTHMCRRRLVAANLGSARLRAYRGRCWWFVQERGEPFRWRGWRQPSRGTNRPSDLWPAAKSPIGIPRCSPCGSPGGSSSRHLWKIGLIRLDLLGLAMRDQGDLAAKRRKKLKATEYSKSSFCPGCASRECGPAIRIGLV